MSHSISNPVFRDPTATAGKTAPLERAHFIDGFRAFAIILVVISHSPRLISSSDDLSGSASTFLNLISGATILFVFISGMLFEHVSLRKFRYSTYIEKKVRVVFVPAILWLLVIGTFYWITSPEIILDRIPDGQSGNFLSRVEETIYFVTSLTPLWYIPFIAIYFFAAPIFRAFSGLRTSEQLGFVLLSICLGLAINHPLDNIDKFQAAAYLVFFYLAGMLVAQHRNTILPFLRKKRVILSAAGMTILLAYLQQVEGHSPTHGGQPFQWSGINYSFIGKTTMIIAATGIFVRFEDIIGRRTKHLADISFGIFFCHWFWIILLQQLYPIGINTGNQILDICASGAVVMVLSLFTVSLIRRKIGSKAVYVLGN